MFRDSLHDVVTDLLVAVPTGVAEESTRTFYTGRGDLGARSVSVRLQQPGGLSHVTMDGELVGDELHLRTTGSAFLNADLVLHRDVTAPVALARARASADSAWVTERARANHPRDILPTRPAPSRATTGGYQTLIANVWVGKPLYLRTDYTYIGSIAGMERNHRFPDGTIRDAVLVSFADGSADWIPRKTLQQIYVTK